MGAGEVEDMEMLTTIQVKAEQISETAATLTLVISPISADQQTYEAIYSSICRAIAEEFNVKITQARRH